MTTAEVAMERWLGRNREAIYALFRFVIGFLFACHGAQKLFGAFGGIPVPLAGLVLAAGVIEFVGGVLVAVGLLTSWAAFICSGQMAVAYFMAHAPGGFWPIANKGEPAVIYCFTFLYIAAQGTGAYGLDSLMRRQPAQA